VGQYLKTNELIGYVITDIAIRYDEEVLAALKEIEGTIKVRILY
jgi:D-3-phosphoglycerate dehydrogenase